MCCSRWGASRTVLALALLLGLFLIVPSHASAQAVTGTLLGNVTDTTRRRRSRRDRHRA